jgi:hypothetical protein
MTLQEFTASLSQAHPPVNISPLLKSLWLDAKGDWNASHNIAQDVNSADGSWVHAYLHRKEGDDGNAAYWYHRAKKTPSKKSLTEEWEEIVSDLLERR